MTLPAAGWFPDPQDVQRLRWWDGRTWGGATQPAARSASVDLVDATPHEAVAPQFSVGRARVDTAAWACGDGVRTAIATAGSPAAASGVASVEARRFCLFGWGSIAVALVSAVVNPLGMLSLLAVVLAVPGFVRPRATGSWRVLGRSLSASAFVIAITTGLVFADGFAQLLHAYARL